MRKTFCLKVATHSTANEHEATFRHRIKRPASQPIRRGAGGGVTPPVGGLGGKTPQKNQGFNEPHQENKEF